MSHSWRYRRQSDAGRTDAALGNGSSSPAQRLEQSARAAQRRDQAQDRHGGHLAERTAMSIRRKFRNRRSIKRTKAVASKDVSAAMGLFESGTFDAVVGALLRRPHS